MKLYTTKKSYKINHKLDCVDKRLICHFSLENAVSNIRVRLLIVLDLGGIIIKCKQEKLRMVIWKMYLQSFNKATFCKMITKIFWKMLRLD